MERLNWRKIAEDRFECNIGYFLFLRVAKVFGEDSWTYSLFGTDSNGRSTVLIETKRGIESHKVREPSYYAKAQCFHRAREIINTFMSLLE